MIQEQVAEAVVIALVSEKNKSKKKKKKRVCVKPWFKRRKDLEYYETLLPELRLEDEYNYKILLQMTFENFEEIFQLTKDDKTKQNTEMT